MSVTAVRLRPRRRSERSIVDANLSRCIWKLSQNRLESFLNNSMSDTSLSLSLETYTGEASRVASLCAADAQEAEQRSLALEQRVLALQHAQTAAEHWSQRRGTFETSAGAQTGPRDLAGDAWASFRVPVSLSLGEVYERERRERRSREEKREEDPTRRKKTKEKKQKTAPRFHVAKPPMSSRRCSSSAR